MSKYYEQIKSNYSRDIDHLVTFNNNGLWIKENLSTGSRIITANKYNGKKLEDITIFNLDKDLPLFFYPLLKFDDLFLDWSLRFDLFVSSLIVLNTFIVLFSKILFVKIKYAISGLPQGP